MQIKIPLIKLLDYTVIPVAGSSTDALIPVVLFFLFIFALFGIFYIRAYSKLRIFRRILQSVSLFFFFHFFHQCFCLLRDWVYGFKKLGIDNIFAFYNLIIPVMVIAFSIIFGRIFCGYLCPFGFFLEIIGIISEKIKSIFLTLFKNLYRDTFNKLFWLISLGASIYLISKASPEKRYILENIAAVWAFIHLIITGFKLKYPLWDTSRIKWYSLSLYIPLAVIGVYTSNPWCPVVSNEVDYSAVAAFFIALAGSMIIPQSFCRFICPLGGLITFIGSYSFFKRRQKSDKLPDTICPVGAIYNNKIINFECNYCGKCEGGNHFKISESLD
jgi:polyferredoxin